MISPTRLGVDDKYPSGLGSEARLGISDKNIVGFVIWVSPLGAYHLGKAVQRAYHLGIQAYFDQS